MSGYNAIKNFYEMRLGKSLSLLPAYKATKQQVEIDSPL